MPDESGLSRNPIWRLRADRPRKVETPLLWWDARCRLLCCEQVAGEVISAIGSDQAQWLDDGSEHPHRIALSMQSSVVPEVCRLLAENCLAKGVKVPPDWPSALPSICDGNLTGQISQEELGVSLTDHAQAPLCSSSRRERSALSMVKLLLPSTGLGRGKPTG